MITIVAIMAILKKRNYMNLIDRNCCNYANSENYVVDSWCLMRTIVAILAILEKSKWILLVAIVAIMASLKKEKKKRKK